MWAAVAACLVVASCVAWAGTSRRAGREARYARDPVDAAMIADLVVAALASGSSVPDALRAVDWALREDSGAEGLDVVARALVMGMDWGDAWEGCSERFAAIRDALEPAWCDGAAAVPLLARTAATIRASRVRRSREAASELGARLVLPLGLCFLPAFVLVGVVPIIASAGLSLFGW